MAGDKAQVHSHRVSDACVLQAPRRIGAKKTNKQKQNKTNKQNAQPLR